MKNKNAIKITLLFASMMTILANAIIAPALPEINKTFAAQPNAEILSKLLMTLPALTIAIFASIIGSLIDKFGRLKILFISLVIFAIAGTSGLWLNSLTQLLVGRFFLGFGVAGIMTATTTLVGDYYKNDERKQFISLQGVGTGFGGLLFITLAGYLSDISWRWPFVVYSFSLMVLFFSVHYLTEPIKESNDVKPKSIVFPPICTKPRFTIYTATFLGIIFFYILPIQIPFLIKSLGNTSNSMSGWAIGALTAAQAMSSFFYSTLKDKLEHLTIYSLTFVIMAVGFILISYSDSYVQILFGLLISGVGVAWLMPNSTLWLMSIAPEKSRGKFMGTLTTFIFLGQFISPIVVQPLQSTWGLKTTFLALGIFLGVLSLVFYLLNSSKNKTQPNATT